MSKDWWDISKASEMLIWSAEDMAEYKREQEEKERQQQEEYERDLAEEQEFMQIVQGIPKSIAHRSIKELTELEDRIGSWISRSWINYKIEIGLARIRSQIRFRQLEDNPIRKSLLPTPGYIYVAEMTISENEIYYKIGKSKDLPTRMKSFELQLPMPVIYSHHITTTDMSWAERYIHHQLRHCRVNGEWFDLGKGELWWIFAMRDISPEDEEEYDLDYDPDDYKDL